MRAILRSSLTITLLSFILILGFHIGSYDNFFVLSYGMRPANSLFAAEKIFYLNLPALIVILTLISIRSIIRKEILIIDNAPRWAKAIFIIILIYILIDPSNALSSWNENDFRLQFQFYSEIFLLYLYSIFLLIYSELKNEYPIYNDLTERFNIINKCVSATTYTCLIIFISYCFSFVTTVYILKHRETTVDRYTKELSMFFKPHINTYYKFRSYRDFVNMFGGKTFVRIITNKSNTRIHHN